MTYAIVKLPLGPSKQTCRVILYYGCTRPVRTLWTKGENTARGGRGWYYDLYNVSYFVNKVFFFCFNIKCTSVPKEVLTTSFHVCSTCQNTLATKVITYTHNYVYKNEEKFFIPLRVLLPRLTPMLKKKGLYFLSRSMCRRCMGSWMSRKEG